MNNEPTKNVQIPPLEGYNVDQIIQMFKEYKQTRGGSCCI